MIDGCSLHKVLGSVIEHCYAVSCSRPSLFIGAVSKLLNVSQLWATNSGLLIAQRPVKERAVFPRIINALKVHPRTKARILRAAGRGDPCGGHEHQPQIHHLSLK